MQTIKLYSKGEDVKVWQRILGVKADGNFGPKTRVSTLSWQVDWNRCNPNDKLIVDGIVGPKVWERAMKTSTKLAVAASAVVGAGALAAMFSDSEDSLRKKVVKAAASQLDNTDASPYWLDVLGPGSHPKDWCGAFALWALHQAGLATDTKWLIGKGFLLAGRQPLKPTHEPKPGDIAYFTKSQHHAVVKEVHDDGTVSLINGNGFNPNIPNGATSEVAASRTPRSNVAAFYSIKPFIDSKLSNV